MSLLYVESRQGQTTDLAHALVRVPLAAHDRRQSDPLGRRHPAAAHESRGSLAAFNLSETAQALDIEWPRLGIRTPIASVRDLWLRKDLKPLRRLKISLAPHASLLYRVVSAAG
jgi:hypothetical protein